MCLLCIQTAKELIKPTDFWNNLKEVPAEHVWQVLAALEAASEEYRKDIAEGTHGS